MSKIQFNSKEAKSFRIIMSKYHDARHALADFLCKRGDDLKSVNTLINSDMDDLEKLENGEKTLRTKDEVMNSLHTLAERKERMKEEYDLAKEACDKACEDAVALVSDDIFRAYNMYINAHFSADSTRAYAEAIADMFRTNGLADATAENCDIFTRTVGKKSNGARASFKTGQLTSAQGKKQFIMAWLGDLADVLVDMKAISAYKYSYVLPDKK